MLFHAFLLIYTAKELDYHAKHDQSLKTNLMYDGVFHSKYTPTLLKDFFFLSMALYNIIKDEIPFMGTSSTCTHQPEREQEHAHQCCWQHSTGFL